MAQIGHYAPGEIEYLIAHDDNVLLELSDVAWTHAQPKAAGGSGLGRLHNRYFKKTGPPEGTWSISRAMLAAADNGDLFEKLLSGAGVVITEAIASSATTHTPGQTLVSIISIKLITSGTVLDYSDDYTVNFATGVITFNSALTEDAEIVYVSTDSDWLGQQLLENTGIEDDITNIWSAIATGTVSRAAAAKYVGTYGLRIAIAAQNDGAQYDPDISVVPNRVYRLTFWAKAASAADDIAVNWTDAGGTVEMTAVGTAGTLSTSWKLHEFTFTPDEATILNLQIIVDDGAAAAQNVDVDEIFLRENDPAIDVMRSGLNEGFSFDIIARRTLDGVTLFRLENCEAFDENFASGEAYTDAISGQYIRRRVLSV